MSAIVSWWFAASMVVCGGPHGSPGVSVCCLLASTMSVGVYRGLRVSAGVSTGQQVVYQDPHMVCGSLRDSTGVYGSPNEFVGTQRESAGTQRVLSGYSAGTQLVHSGYSAGTQQVLSRYSAGVRRGSAGTSGGQRVPAGVSGYQRGSAGISIQSSYTLFFY